MVNDSLGFLCVVTKYGLDVVSQHVLNLQGCYLDLRRALSDSQGTGTEITLIRISYLILVPGDQMDAYSSHKKK